MDATFACPTTLSSSLSPFLRIASWPARVTPRCRRNRRLPNPSCAKLSSPFPCRCDVGARCFRIYLELRMCDCKLRSRVMAALRSTLAHLLAKADRPGVRAFFLSMAALSGALLLALYSSAAAELGQLVLASTSALAALAIAGWVAVTLVPALARRTPLRWIGFRIEY